MTRFRHRFRLLNFALGIALVASSVAWSGGLAFAAGRTYTTDVDFDSGEMIGVEHDTTHDQLQLSSQPVALPYIWIPNESGTVSKVHTVDGRELGRYQVTPDEQVSGDPSRTTVDLDGKCWVGNRSVGTVVAIGLWETGQWVDRNGNGVCDTSRDVNENGIIDPSEILPWGEDEAVLLEISVMPGYEGPHAPGTYEGPYSDDFAWPGPRSLAVDQSGNMWIGCYGTHMFYRVDSDTGDILETLPVPGHWPYGALTDAQGNVWSSGQFGGDVLRIDPSTTPATVTQVPLGDWAYGLALSEDGYLYVTGWTTATNYKIDVETAEVVDVWQVPEQYASRGVAVTADGDVWIADYTSTVFRYNPDGTLVAAIPFTGRLTGVAVDAAGKVWTCGLDNEAVGRIDPATNEVDLVKELPGSLGHYGYSDMTGYVSYNITTKLGIWRVVADGGSADPHWGSLEWNADVPADTSLAIRVRSSADQATWSAWDDVLQGEVPDVPDDRYLQIEATFQSTSDGVSPVLYDLTANRNSEPVLAVSAPLVTVDEGETALNAGTVSDIDGDDVTLTASKGMITSNNGAWSWWAAALDGPAGSGLVGISADDGHGGLASASFDLVVRNVAPAIGAIAAPHEPTLLGTTIAASADFTDPGVLDTHTALWDWGDGSQSEGDVDEVDGSGSASGEHVYDTPGVYVVTLTVTDSDGDASSREFTYVVIYDPEGGFVTGGGTIQSPLGAYRPDPTLVGKASFGFVAKYRKGATVPTGNTEFQFHAPGMNFHSTEYQWLVVAGSKAKYKGWGTVNGVEGYGFMLSAVDDDPDRLRIKIWEVDTDEVVYDNQFGDDDSAETTTELSKGNIVIHKK